MIEQLRSMIEKALAKTDSSDPARRQETYRAVRLRMEDYLAGRTPPPAEDQKRRLLDTLEGAIAEAEARYTPPASRSRHEFPGQQEGASDMTTESTQPEKKGRAGAAVAALGVLVVAAAAGAWWWNQYGGAACTVDGAAATPARLRNVTESPEGLAVSGADPQIVLSVPASGAEQRACIALTIDSEKEDTLEIFLPDPDSAKGGFAAGRSITKKLDAGNNQVSLELPEHAKGRLIRVDPVVNATNSTVKIIQFGKM